MLWPVTWPSTVDKSAATPEQVSLAENFAVSAIQMLTLYRVGAQAITLMPDARHRVHGIHLWGRVPGGDYAGEFYLDGVFPSGADLQVPARSIDPVALPGPVSSIVSVTIDGVTVDPSEYVVENGEYLIRLAGEWPQNYGPSFVVTYMQGFEVDLMGQYVAGLLAAEFLNAITNAKKCRLPSGVTDMVRQGITMKLPIGIFDGGQTGITEVDMYIAQWNPNRLRTRPQVYTMDRPRARQVSWRP